MARGRCGRPVRIVAVEWWEALLLVLGGVAAGLINAVAGGGSILTVPLLVLAGVPGNDANGSNRVGILTSNAAAATAFRKLGVRGLSHSTPILVADRRRFADRLVRHHAAHRRQFRAGLRAADVAGDLPVDPQAARSRSTPSRGRSG